MSNGSAGVGVGIGGLGIPDFEIEATLGSAVSSASWWWFLDPAQQARILQQGVTAARRALAVLNPAVGAAEAGLMAGNVLYDAGSRIQNSISANPDAYNPLYYGDYNLTDLFTNAFESAADAAATAGAGIRRAADNLNPIGWSMTTIILVGTAVVVGLQLLSASKR